MHLSQHLTSLHRDGKPVREAYRGYLIVQLLATTEVAISKDGFHISYADDLVTARQVIDLLREESV